MRNSEIRTNKTIYFPEYIDGRWYVKDLKTGEIAYTISFPIKSLSEMMCANFMGLRSGEAKLLWVAMGLYDETDLGIYDEDAYDEAV